VGTFSSARGGHVLDSGTSPRLCGKKEGLTIPLSIIASCYTATTRGCILSHHHPLKQRYAHPHIKLTCIMHQYHIAVRCRAVCRAVVPPSTPQASQPSPSPSRPSSNGLASQSIVSFCETSANPLVSARATRKWFGTAVQDEIRQGETPKTKIREKPCTVLR